MQKSPPSPICTQFEHHLAGVLAPLSRTEATKLYNWRFRNDNYREILRLSRLQYSQRTIESMAHCPKHTVRDVLQAASEQGVSWPLSNDITNAELEQLLFPNKHKASSQYAEPNHPYIHRELARSGVTLTLLWEDPV